MQLEIGDISVVDVLDAIDVQRIEALRKKYLRAFRTTPPAASFVKYFALEKYIEKNIRRARELCLHRLPKKRVLDLGSGCGYFLLVCRFLGHDALGVDYFDEDSLACHAYADVCGLLKVDRCTERIKPLQRLANPRLAGPFEFITAYQICFDDFNGPGRWNVREWSVFLRDLRSRLTPDGEILLTFNRPDRDSLDYPGKLFEAFRAFGANCSGHTAHFWRRKMDWK